MGVDYRFQKIFPTPNTYEYLQYLESPRYYNLLFDAWETKYHKNRQEGIYHACALKTQKFPYCFEYVCQQLSR